MPPANSREKPFAGGKEKGEFKNVMKLT